MRYVGYSENFHDAGLAILSEEGEIELAVHAERYTKVKNDPILPDELWSFIQENDDVTFYEDPTARAEGAALGNYQVQHHSILPNTNMYDQCILHHVSHVAGAMFTRPWKDPSDTVLLSIDGYGEREFATIYDTSYNRLKEWTESASIGILYSTTTKHLGLRPLEDEYVVMGLSSYGEVSGKWYDYLNSVYNTNPSDGLFKLTRPFVESLSREDVAATIQKFTEDKIYEIAQEARKYGSKLTYSGGVAQNIIANTQIRDLFDEVWIPPAVSDAGSALGAAAYTWGQRTGKDRIQWKDAYLGYNIDREINPREVVDHLLEHQYCGIANGKAEYGPRALGNRSLIADVRYDVKDTVNTIKQRQKYRPFAPAILEEYSEEYFEGHMNEYMQYTAKALHDYSSVTHVDGTARVQIVKKDCTSVFRKVIEEYYERTGVPMLLNTSLNIRGRPIVNDELDAKLFEQKYKVKVF